MFWGCSHLFVWLTCQLATDSEEGMKMEQINISLYMCLTRGRDRLETKKWKAIFDAASFAG